MNPTETRKFLASEAAEGNDLPDTRWAQLFEQISVSFSIDVLAGPRDGGLTAEAAETEASLIRDALANPDLQNRMAQAAWNVLNAELAHSSGFVRRAPQTAHAWAERNDGELRRIAEYLDGDPGALPSERALLANRIAFRHHSRACDGQPPVDVFPEDETEE